MTRIIITGSKGRMGQALINCAVKFPELQVVGQIDKGDDLSKVIEKCDAVIDFSFHNITPEVTAICAKHKKALVIGTTGHSEAEQLEIKKHKSEVPIVWSSNSQPASGSVEPPSLTQEFGASERSAMIVAPQAMPRTPVLSRAAAATIETSVP